MDKLSGVVVYREATKEGFLWAARVYNASGKIIFQSVDYKRSFKSAMEIAKWAAVEGEIHVQIGPAKCSLYVDVGNYKPAWLDGWLKTNLEAEAKRYVKRMNRRSRALHLQLEAERKRLGLPSRSFTVNKVPFQ